MLAVCVINNRNVIAMLELKTVFKLFLLLHTYTHTHAHMQTHATQTHATHTHTHTDSCRSLVAIDRYEFTPVVMHIDTYTYILFDPDLSLSLSFSLLNGST